MPQLMTSIKHLKRTKTPLKYCENRTNHFKMAAKKTRLDMSEQKKPGKILKSHLVAMLWAKTKWLI